MPVAARWSDAEQRETIRVRGTGATSSNNTVTRHCTLIPSETSDGLIHNEFSQTRRFPLDNRTNEAAVEL